MRKISQIKIKNLRGITNLTIKDCGNVNILVGRNGAGKTSIMEGIAFASMGNEPENFPGIVGLRGERNMHVAIQSLHNQNSTNIEINLVTAIGSYGTSIEPPTFYSQAIGGRPDGGPKLLKMVCRQTHPKRDGGKTTHRREMTLTPSGVQMLGSADISCKRCIDSFFVSGRATGTEADREVLSALTQADKIGELISMLALVEPVSDIRLTDDSIIVKAAGTMRPLKSMGDGFNRLFIIGGGLLLPRVELVLVDEIDSGLHPSLMGKFWKHLNTFLEKTGSQIFCTTHNEQMIEAAVMALGADEVRKIHVVKQNSKVSTVTLMGEDLRYEVETGFATTP